LDILQNDLINVKCKGLTSIKTYSDVFKNKVPGEHLRSALGT